jgi:uncharacterized membrane protein HdeD (DUF308 family)
MLQAVFNIAVLLAICGAAVITVGAFLSVMAFDAPGSQGRWQAWAFVIGMFLLAVAGFAAIAFAKSFFEQGRVVAAFACLALPAAIGTAFVIAKIVN